MSRISPVRIRVFLILALVALAAPWAAAKDLVNADKNGLALEGYDPVAFQLEGKAIPGLPSITASHAGATYRFVSENDRKAFLADPAKYAPAYGGYCAFGTAKGKLVPVQIATWQIVDGRLMLNYDASVAKSFNEDREGYVKKADANWPHLLDEHGK